MKWFDPKKKLPPQGKKIIWFSKGDSHLVQRFGKYWVPFPFTDSRLAHLNPPELWADVHYPEPYKGMVKVCVEGLMYTIDELEEYYPNVYRSVIAGILMEYRHHRR